MLVLRGGSVPNPHSTLDNAHTRAAPSLFRNTSPTPMKSLILIPDSNHFDLYLEDWELTIGPVRFGWVYSLCQFHMGPLRFTVLVSVVQDLPYWGAKSQGLQPARGIIRRDSREGTFWVWSNFMNHDQDFLAGLTLATGRLKGKIHVFGQAALSRVGRLTPKT